MELHQYSHRMCGPMKKFQIDTRSRESNSGPQDCEAKALPHDHGHRPVVLTSDITRKERI